MNSSDQPPLDKSELEGDLKNIGLKKGDRVIIHSSLKSIGPIKGGADTFLELLMEILGNEGAIAMPTFTYSFVGRKQGFPFHPERSLSETGVLTEIFRKRPGVIRSFHPTHSVAVWGNNAFFYTSEHLKTTALGENSPFHKLALDNAKILLVGVDFTTISLIHIGEILSRVYYRDIFCWKHLGWKPQARIARDDDTVEIVDLHEVPGCSRSFGVLEEIAFQENLIQKQKLGKTTIKIVSSLKLLELTKKVLFHKKDFLLCPTKTCRVCDERRE